MPKGYAIVHEDVTDPDRHAEYRAGVLPLIERFGGRFLVRGGDGEVVEGAARARHVVIEFPSLEAARAFHAAPDYAPLRALRDAAATSDFIIVEGVA
jgi:uncharacterized protein (DUF1330 family)